MKVAYEVVRARRQRLADLLREHAYLPVGEICARLAISESTVRRDLAVLAKAHQVRRTYGGALIDYDADFDSFHQRQERAREAKLAIAAQALRLIEPGMALYLDGGTTLHYLAKALTERAHGKFQIYTNNLQIADLLGEFPSFETLLIGGRYLKRQGCCLGPITEATLQRLSFDLAFLGAQAVNGSGVFNSADAIVRVQHLAMQQAERSVLCVDTSKFREDQTGARLCSVSEFDYLLSDTPPSRIPPLAQADSC